jgi:hypothetical protein
LWLIDSPLLSWDNQCKKSLSRDDDDVRLNLAFDCTHPEATRDRCCGGGSAIFDGGTAAGFKFAS